MPAHVRTYFSEAVDVEIPHLRAYARLMMNDVCRAEREVEETLKRAFSITDRMSKRADLRVQLLMILRSFLIGIEHRSFGVPSAAYERLNGPFRVGNGHSEGSLSLASALACLDYQDREALVLSVGARLSRQDAAAICGCGASVLGTRISRGFARLAELLPSELVDDLSQVPEIAGALEAGV